jgi:diadenosine tetraphosphate (Ap4A) HIT family hydrolase
MQNFLDIPKERILATTENFFIIKDAFPVSPGHLLIISHIVRKDFFELTSEEKQELMACIELAREIIKNEYNPDGYNIGMNCGQAAGQTVFHFHCHVIPRYIGDMENPRGGVRHCVAGKGDYDLFNLKLTS